MSLRDVPEAAGLLCRGLSIQTQMGLVPKPVLSMCGPSIIHTRPAARHAPGPGAGVIMVGYLVPFANTFLTCLNASPVILKALRHHLNVNNILGRVD